MWSLKVLSGPLAGKSFPLRQGANTVGRAPSCDVILASIGISKQHAKIEVYPDKIVVTDMSSRNGTFINGVQIRSQKLNPGDKIALYDLMMVVAPQEASKRPAAQVANPPALGGGPLPLQQAAYAYQGNAALQTSPQPDFGAPAPLNLAGDPAPMPEGDAVAQTVPGIKQYMQRYMDEIILPGVYRLAEWMEFKQTVMLFCGVFVLVVTMLSTIPLTRILKYRIEKTSQQRALSIARTLALSNKSSVAQGLATGISISVTDREPGVDKAFIVNAEGRILAPQALAQQYPDIPFIHAARRLGKEVVQQIDDTTIGALVPIEVQNEQTGIVAPMAHAVVIYDMGTLAVDDGQTFSLFIQTLFIALIVGAIIFFFLYKLIEHPIRNMNDQVSKTLRDGHGTLLLNYRFPILQELISNVNALISRGAGGSNFSQPGSYEHERSGESLGLVNMVGFPSIAVQASSRRVLSVNSHFQDAIAKSQNWDGLLLDDVLDQALKLNLRDLVERASGEPNQTAVSEIDVDGVNYDIRGQAVYGSKDVNYVLIVFIPKDGG